MTFPVGGGGIDLVLGVVGKTEPKVSGFKSLFFFWGGAKSLTAINMCLGERK